MMPKIKLLRYNRFMFTQQLPFLSKTETISTPSAIEGFMAN